MEKILTEINYMRRMAGKPILNEEGGQTFQSADQLEKHLKGLAKNDVQFDIFKAYADKFNAEQGNKLKNNKFEGTWSNKADLLEGAKFIKSHGTFNEKTAEKVTQLFGENAKYKLGREEGVVIYVKDTDQCVPVPETQFAPLPMTESSEFSNQGNVYRLWWK